MTPKKTNASVKFTAKLVDDMKGNYFTNVPNDVSGSVCIKCKTKVSAVPHPSKLCYECWKKSKQTDG